MFKPCKYRCLLCRNSRRTLPHRVWASELTLMLSEGFDLGRFRGLHSARRRQRGRPRLLRSLCLPGARDGKLTQFIEPDLARLPIGGAKRGYGLDRLVAGRNPPAIEMSASSAPQQATHKLRHS